MSRSELINSALEVKNNCSEESETSDNEYFYKVCMFEHEYMYKPCVLEEFMKKKTAREKNDQIQKKTLVGLEIFLVVNTNQWLLMQKVFVAWISIKVMKCFSTIFIQ